MDNSRKKEMYNILKQLSDAVYTKEEIEVMNDEELTTCWDWCQTCSNTANEIFANVIINIGNKIRERINKNEDCM